MTGGKNGLSTFLSFFTPDSAKNFDIVSMKWQISINQQQDIKAERTESPNKLVINGQPQLFELVERGEKHFIVQLNNRSIEVYVLKYEPAEKKGVFIVNGKKCSVSATDEMDMLLKKLGMDNAGARQVKELKAPMPGMVVKVEVEAGSVVKKDQALIILEAMKMENVLKAQADGVVQNVEVKKGQAVEKNQVLVRFN